METPAKQIVGVATNPVCYALVLRMRFGHPCTNTLYNKEWTNMLTVNISDLRANLLKYLEKASHGELITVTTNGRVLATITPPSDRKAMAKKQLEQLATTARIHDVASPIDTHWNALS